MKLFLLIILAAMAIVFLEHIVCIIVGLIILKLFDVLAGKRS